MKTVKQPNAINKLVLLLGEQIFVGVDVHKLTRHVALWSRERGLLGSWVQPSDANVLERHLSRIEPAMLRIVYEAGPTGFSLARRFRARGYSIQVIAPYQRGKMVAPVFPSHTLTGATSTDSRMILNFNAALTSVPIAGGKGGMGLQEINNPNRIHVDMLT